MNRLRVNAQIFFLRRNVYSGSFYHFHCQMISNSIQFDRYGLKSFDLWGKVGPMLSGETRTKRKKITFQTKFWAGGDAETYLHGTTLSDCTIVCSKL